MSIEFLDTDFDKVSYLANLLTARATGLAAEDYEYTELRQELLSNEKLLNLLPGWLKQHRNLDSFWGFIKQKFSTYAERRTYISEEFTAALDYLEFGSPAAARSTQPTRSKSPVQAQPSKVVTRN